MSLYSRMTQKTQDKLQDVHKEYSAMGTIITNHLLRVDSVTELTIKEAADIWLFLGDGLGISDFNFNGIMDLFNYK